MDNGACLCSKLPRVAAESKSFEALRDHHCGMMYEWGSFRSKGVDVTTSNELPYASPGIYASGKMLTQLQNRNAAQC
jgi:hypothetical protein